MKNALFSLLLIFSSATIHSQSRIIGDNLGVYVDINPDTLVDGYPCASQSTSEEFSFDINGDLQNDFTVYAFCQIGGVYFTSYVNVIPQNLNSHVAFGRYDSVYNVYMNYWMVLRVAKPFMHGDTFDLINASWDTSSLTISFNGQFTGTSQSVYDFVDSTDKYIGLLYVSSADTILGWLRINCPNGGACTIKDYSFGSVITGFNKDEIHSITVYPNPVTENMIIENLIDKSTEAVLLNIKGQILYDKLLQGNSSEKVEMNGLSSGIYILKLISGSKISYKKIVLSGL